MYEMQCDTENCTNPATSGMKLGKNQYVLCRRCHRAKRHLVRQFEYAWADLNAEWTEKVLAPLPED